MLQGCLQGLILRAVYKSLLSKGQLKYLTLIAMSASYLLFGGQQLSFGRICFLWAGGRMSAKFWQSIKMIKSHSFFKGLIMITSLFQCLKKNEYCLHFRKWIILHKPPKTLFLCTAISAAALSKSMVPQSCIQSILCTCSRWGKQQLSVGSLLSELHTSSLHSCGICVNEPLGSLSNT